VSTPVFAQADDTGASNSGDVDPRITAYQDHNNPENIALDLQQKGKCDEAVPIFRRLAAAQGRYEETQFHLAVCLFALAKKQHDAQHASALNTEGAGWILRAADAGVVKAQAIAVQLYLDGSGVAADPVEAGKWAYILHDNGTRLALGEPDLDPALRGRLDAALNADKRRQAHTRAESWTSASEQAEP
jgi:TPR repeat protein